MKNQILILMFSLLIFSCDSEAEDARIDWVKKIDNKIVKYNNSAQIENTKVIDEFGGKTKVIVYNKNSEGIYKVKGEYKEADFEMISEFYIQNDMIILEKKYGLTPLLYKRQRKDNEPCCQILEILNYYKSKEKAKQYERELKFLYPNDYKLKDLDDINLEDVKDEGIGFNNYSESEQQLQHLKELLVN
ncbi:hypothetical protein [Gaetbulibacter sp. PBL-D1]|uniref:hypothetical protein n=1 Tax=Gaetbulibacter sp. PBL-D1 TaxID=3422594 RepID=UPI003D2F4B87